MEELYSKAHLNFGQKIFNHRAKMNTLAAQGKWSEEIEN